MTTVGTAPPRIDIDIRVGEPLDFSVPVLDENDTPVTSLAGWAAAAQIRLIPSTAVLHTFTPVIETPFVRITAPSATTTAWTWRVAEWDVVLTEPSGAQHVLCRGWVRVHPTITRAI